MLLRRLFCGMLGALRRERKVLLQQVPTETSETAPDASERLATIMSAAQQLHDNSAAEFRIFMQLTAAYRRGVGFHSFTPLLSDFLAHLFTPGNLY